MYRGGDSSPWRRHDHSHAAAAVEGALDDALALGLLEHFVVVRRLLDVGQAHHRLLQILVASQGLVGHRLGEKFVQVPLPVTLTVGVADDELALEGIPAVRFFRKIPPQTRKK